MSVPAGWYPDSQPDVMRYWDGSAWTDHTHVTSPSTVIPPYPGTVTRQTAGKKPSLVPTWLKIVIPLTLVAIVGAFVGVSLVTSARQPKDPWSYPQLKYLADDDSHGGSVTYQTVDGVRQANEIQLPFRYSQPLMTSNNYLYLSVQNTGDGGKVSCLITVDGKTVSQNESFGPYAIATCSGTW